MHILELFCGIGSVTAAVKKAAFNSAHSIVAAIDINQVAVEVYQANFDDVTHVKEIASLSDATLAAFSADLWWMSPPCQPFTRRGLQKDLADARTQPLQRLIDAIATVQPAHIALENVIGFESSRTFGLLRDTLHRNGYGVATTKLCSSQFGFPNFRPRFFMTASQSAQPVIATPNRTSPPMHVASFLDSPAQLARWEDDLLVDPVQLSNYAMAVNIVSASEDRTCCFTSAYGRSMVRSGSYLKTDNGVRRFSPTEISRFLGLPASFVLPEKLTTVQAWRLLGNAVSVPAVEFILRSIE